MSNTLVLLAASFFLAPAAALAAESGIIAPGAKLTKLAGGFTFTEGPAADADGNVYFTDQPNNRIMKWRRRRQAYHLYEAVRAVQRPMLRRQGKALAPAPTRRTRCGRSTRRTRNHRRHQGLPGQAAQRPQRRLAAARRRAVLHRSLLPAALLEAAARRRSRSKASTILARITRS